MNEQHIPTQTKIRALLRSNLLVQISEIILVFLVAFVIIILFRPLAADQPVLVQFVVWCANLVMLSLVWFGMYVRGETWKDFGLTFGAITWKQVFTSVALSLLVFALAVAGFLIGSIIMANITGIPDQADMSAYAFLQNNPGMLILSLCGIYLVSSFGEEVIYRAFLINRLQQMGLNGKLGTVGTIILSAVIFGFAHYQWGPIGIVQTTMMGIVLSASYLKLHRRLWILVLAHAYMDTILMIQMYLASNS